MKKRVKVKKNTSYLLSNRTSGFFSAVEIGNRPNGWYIVYSVENKKYGMYHVTNEHRDGLSSSKNLKFLLLHLKFKNLLPYEHLINAAKDKMMIHEII